MALPVQFTDVPAVKKPGKRSTDEEREAYKQAIKVKNLSTAFVADLKAMRKLLDDTGAANKVMLTVVDGSFCNRTCMTADVERTILIARTRKDAKLCFAAPSGSKRVYNTDKFTPEDALRQDEHHTMEEIADLSWRGVWREIRYKVVDQVLWQGGTQRMPLRLIVIAAFALQGLAQFKAKIPQYGYLLCTDCTTDVEVLLQAYFDRWQIEVNHRGPEGKCSA